MIAPGTLPTPEELAEVFHDTYERLAPQFGYMTRPDSRTPWASVPDKNRQLMIATCAEILARLRPACMTTEEDTRFVRDLDERQIESCNKSTGYRLHLKASEVNRIVRVLESITGERDALRADLTRVTEHANHYSERVGQLVLERDAERARYVMADAGWKEMNRQNEELKTDLRACAEALYDVSAGLNHRMTCTCVMCVALVRPGVQAERGK